MRSIPRLGSVNAALVSVYFALIWGSDAIRALTSPFNGFEDPVHATAASYFRNLFDFTLDGLIRTAQVLAGIKLVIAVAFVAYLIDFARALLMRREPNRETLDWVLLLASLAIMLWAWPALGQRRARADPPARHAISAADRRHGGGRDRAADREGAGVAAAQPDQASAVAAPGRASARRSRAALSFAPAARRGKFC